MILYALAAVVITDVASGVALRKKRVDALMEVLRSEPGNAAALAHRKYFFFCFLALH
jgi:hypothetical protein